MSRPPEQDLDATLSRHAVFVRNVFATVPGTYEATNRVLTLGLDSWWRRRAVKTAVAGAGARWIDLCTGTGETAALLADLAPQNTRVLALDFSPPMLDQARRKPQAARILFLQGDVAALPFRDQTFDLVTMSFATRNINVNRPALVQRLAGFHRILKPGGRFVNLETSQPRRKLLRKLRDIYVRLFVESVGARLSGARPAYTYLSKTIPQFYSAEEFADILREAGFASASYQYLLFGVAAIHQGVR